MVNDDRSKVKGKAYKATIAFPAFDKQKCEAFEKWKESLKQPLIETSSNLGCTCCYHEYEIIGTEEQLLLLPHNLIQHSEFINRSPAQGSLRDPDFSAPKAAALLANGLPGHHYKLDYSLDSLKNEVDALLEHWANYKSRGKPLSVYLSAYIGETIRKIYDGSWEGTFHESDGANFYTSSMRVGKYVFHPSHFIGYYMSNGKASEGSFKGYLFTRNFSKGIFRDFLGGGLIVNIEKAKKGA